MVVASQVQWLHSRMQCSSWCVFVQRALLFVCLLRCGLVWFVWFAEAKDQTRFSGMYQTQKATAQLIWFDAYRHYMCFFAPSLFSILSVFFVCVFMCVCAWFNHWFCCFVCKISEPIQISGSLFRNIFCKIRK